MMKSPAAPLALVLALVALLAGACTAPVGEDGHVDGEVRSVATYLVDWPSAVQAVPTRDPVGGAIGGAELYEPDSCSIDAHIRQLAGPRARDCGRVEIGQSAEAATWCAWEAFAFGEPFHVEYVLQGYEGTVIELLTGNDEGHVFITHADPAPCGLLGGCEPSFDTFLCDAPSLGEDGRIACQEELSLLSVLCW